MDLVLSQAIRAYRPPRLLSISTTTPYLEIGEASIRCNNRYVERSHVGGDSCGDASGEGAKTLSMRWVCPAVTFTYVPSMEMRSCSSALACRMIVTNHHFFDRAHEWSFEGLWKVDLANDVCRISCQHHKASSKRQRYASGVSAARSEVRERLSEIRIAIASALLLFNTPVVPALAAPSRRRLRARKQLAH